MHQLEGREGVGAEQGREVLAGEPQHNEVAAGPHGGGPGRAIQDGHLTEARAPAKDGDGALEVAFALEHLDPSIEHDVPGISRVALREHDPAIAHPAYVDDIDDAGELFGGQVAKHGRIEEELERLFGARRRGHGSHSWDGERLGRGAARRHRVSRCRRTRISMSRTGLATGERVGRWRVTAPAPAVGGVHRARVADDTGRPGEALVLGSDASWEARHAFAERHRALAGLRSEHLCHTLEVVEEASRVVVIRQPTEDATLADASLPLRGDLVAAIGARLATAVQDAGPYLPSAVFLHDIALDAEGQPIFAPLAIEPSDIGRDTLGQVAPEAFQGAAPDSDAALYGLGAVLYHLCTNHPLSARGDGAAPPPVPASSRRHGLPQPLDRALATLLDVTPETRRGALPWLQEAAGTVEDLRPSTRTSRSVGRTGEVIYTRVGPSARDRRGMQAPAALVVLSPEAYQRLEPGARALAQGLAGVGARFADRHASDGHPLVLSTAGGRAAASAEARQLMDAHGLPAEALSGGGVPGAVPFIVGLGVAAVPAFIGVLLLLVGWLPASLGLFALAAVLAVVAAVGGRHLGRGRREGARAIAAHELQQTHRAERSPDGRLDAAWDRIARLRVQLATQDHLPSPAESDLRSALKETEDRLDGISSSVRVSGGSLEHVDASGLRTRLAALERRVATDPAVRGERDRLAATVADLDAVDTHRLRILDDVRNVDADLDDIAAALGHVGVDDPQALSKLAKAVSSDERRRKAQAARAAAHKDGR